LEVKSADATIDIEDLSDEVEVGALAGLVVFAIDFIERDAAGGHFCVGEAAVGLDVDFGRGEEVGEGSSCVSMEGVAWCCGVDVGLITEGFGESIWDEGAEVGAQLGFAEACEELIGLLEGVVWEPVDLQVCFAITEFSGGEVSGNVHRGGT